MSWRTPKSADYLSNVGTSYTGLATRSHTTLFGPAATVNLIGGPHRVGLAARLTAALDIPGAHIHLYAKTSHPGRKLGHATALGVSTEDALETARATATLLTQP